MRLEHVLLFVLAVSPFLAADQVTISNGDRLTGTIVKSDEKKFILKTDYAGEITLDWSAVQAISSSEPLHVILKNGQTLSGPVTTSDDHLQVATADSGKVETSKSEVAAIRGEPENAAYEKSLHPGLMDNWSGGANVAFALTRGNSQTKNLALAFTATRETLHDKFGAYSTSVYATNDAPGSVPSTTANAVQAGVRYDHDLTPKLFGFVGADFQTDSLQGLDLRSVPTAGVGVHLIKNADTTLDVFAGANYTRERYTTLTRNFAAATLGEELLHKLRGSTVITQKLHFFPDLSDFGQYRGTFDFGTVTKLNKWLGWQNAFGDVYVTNPPAGKKRNDILLTTGLNLSFTH